MEMTEQERLQERLKEVVKIYVTPEMHAQLTSDARRFNIYKKPGVLNMNLFLNNLITGYLEDFSKQVSQTAQRILRNMDPYLFSAKQKEFEHLAKAAAFDLLSERSTYSGNLTKRFSITIHRNSADLLCEKIYQTTDSSDLSAYLRGLFAEYLSLPIYQREKIIYGKTVKKIEDIIKSGDQLIYANRKQNRSHLFNPYSIVASKDEIHNYLVGQTDSSKHNTCVRLDTIAHVWDAGTPASFTEDFPVCYAAMVRNGVQYGSIDRVVIRKIQLSPEGVKRFGYHYMDRPEPVKTEPLEDGSAIYSFDCSESQLTSYFFPFMEEKEVHAVRID